MLEVNRWMGLSKWNYCLMYLFLHLHCRCFAVMWTWLSMVIIHDFLFIIYWDRFSLEGSCTDFSLLERTKAAKSNMDLAGQVIIFFGRTLLLYFLSFQTLFPYFVHTVGPWLMLHLLSVFLELKSPEVSVLSSTFHSTFLLFLVCQDAHMYCRSRAE